MKKDIFSPCLGERDGVNEVADVEHELNQYDVGKEDGINSCDLLLYFVL